MARADSIGAPGKHLAAHRAISGQVFWQSGAAGPSCAQHGMSSDMVDMAAAAAIAPPFTGATSGPSRSPTIARNGSKPLSHEIGFMRAKLAQARAKGKRRAALDTGRGRKRGRVARVTH